MDTIAPTIDLTCDLVTTDPRERGSDPFEFDTKPEVLIDYQWALDVVTFERLGERVPLLRAAARTFDVPASTQPDERLILQLESAGLHLDSLPRRTIGCAPARIVAGRTTPRELAEAIEALANDAGSGGQLIDTCVDPVRITEVRELNARTIVCVSPQGGRLVAPTVERVAAVLEE